MSIYFTERKRYHGMNGNQLMTFPEIEYIDVTGRDTCYLSITHTYFRKHKTNEQVREQLKCRIIWASKVCVNNVK